MKDPQPAQPVVDELTWPHWLFSSLSITAALGLLGWLAWRVMATLELGQWWVPVALVAGLCAADAASGLVHWAADTWGRDDCPVIGPRLLVPFRVHHVNPDDFLRRRFAETNGEAACLAVPLLVALVAMPLDGAAAKVAAVFGLGFCGLGAFTNQIHQWAHMPEPPAPVRALQTCGLLLGHAEHSAHHARPYDRRYCITTGWCNAPLDAIGFFRRLETGVTWLTGVAPRHDDRLYETRYGVSARRIESGRA